MATELKEQDINIIYFDVGNHIDDLRKTCIDSWHKFLPNANYICITEKDPELKQYLENSKWAEQCLRHKMVRYAIDVFRLMLAEKYDNYLYLDTDVFMKKNPIELLKENDEICGIELIDKVKVPQNGTIFWLRNKTDKFKEIINKYNTQLKFDFNNTNGVVNKDNEDLFNLVDVEDYFHHVHFGYFFNILNFNADEVIIIDEYTYGIITERNLKNEDKSKIWIINYNKSIKDSSDKIDWDHRTIKTENVALPYILKLFNKRNLKIAEFKDLNVEDKKQILGV